MQINKYYLSALSSFVIWGFFSLVLKPLHNYPSLDILFYRVFYATGLSIIINLLFRKEKLKNDWKSYLTLEKKEKIKTLLLTVLGGFLLTFNWFMFIYAINHVSLKSASFTYLICPIVTTILAYFILKEKLSKWQWFSVFLCIISCAMLSYGDLRGLIYSLVIAISFALYLISQRENNKFDRFVVLTVQLLIASMVLLPFFPVYRGEIPTEPIFYILMTIIVVLFTIIPLFLNLFALRGITSSAVGILMYSNPMINLLLAIFYFKEEINSVQIGSYLLILFSIIIFNEKLLRVSKD
ncbi:EamA family transporter [Flavobacterium psychrophilum]|uniref:EamA family transporter n=1 Tax=Flavobacterium psychrophilum TaxID=96345 RepID=UPI000B7C2B3A|nr:EamA family transporter [Flavobacterium psychrophilum]SNB01319.1 putative permease YojE [Flavobacterium psychrophilum]